MSDGVKFIRSQNVYNDGLRLNDIAYITEETNSKKSGSVVKAKDILLNITGGSIGRCAIVPDNFDIANVNQHVMIIRFINPAMPMDTRNFNFRIYSKPHHGCSSRCFEGRSQCYKTNEFSYSASSN